MAHRRVQAPLRVTERADYALKSVLLLSLHDGEYVTARSIADRYAMSPRMLASVLWNLAEAGLVESRPGWRGGFRLARPAAKIRLNAVITAANVESDNPSADETLGSPPLTETVVHLVDDLWKGLDERVQDALGSITVADLALGVSVPALGTTIAAGADGRTTPTSTAGGRP